MSSLRGKFKSLQGELRPFCGHFFSLSHCNGAVNSTMRGIRTRTEPAFIEPMRWKPITTLPTDEKWTFEIKFDGYRCIVVKRDAEVTLFSRNEKVLNKRFPKGRGGARFA
jgi:ATP-dependent DNA ligase